MKKDNIILLMLFCYVLMNATAWTQVVGDFQSHQTGNWNDTSTWERWDGSNWITPAPSTPTSSDGVITIRNGHAVTVTAGVTVDEVTLDAGGQITVSGVTLTVADGAGTDLIVNGTLSGSGTLAFNGSDIANGGAISVTTTNFSGTGAQSISGSGTWTGSNITIGSSTNTSLANSASFGCWGTLTVNSGGTLTVNNPLTVEGANITNRGTVTISSTLTCNLGGSNEFNNYGGISGTGTVGIAGGGNYFNQRGSFSPQLNVLGGLIFKTGYELGGDITINSDATLILTNSTRVYGNITNNGTLTGQNESLICNGASFTNNGQFNGFVYVRFSGSSTQTIGGSTATSFPDLIILNEFGVTLNKDITVGGTLTLFAGALSIGANTLTLNGAISTSGGSITGGSTSNIIFGGTGASTALPAVTLNNLTLNRSNGITLGGNITIEGTLTITNGDLDLNGNDITLGTTATMSETAFNTVFGTTGKITTTRNIENPSGLDVGGMGVVLTTTANLESTTINRGHAAQTGCGNTGIFRYYDITPTNNSGLNATLVFIYDHSELNGITESNLKFYKSTDGGTTWTLQGGTVDAGANTITLTGIGSFSRWSVGDPNPPVPAAYQTHQTGNWNDVNTWESQNESGWDWPAQIPPSSGDAVITILNGHTVTVTANVTVDEVTVDAGGQITVNGGIDLTVADGAGTDLTVNGELGGTGELWFNGSAIINNGIIGITNFIFNSGGAQSISGGGQWLRWKNINPPSYVSLTNSTVLCQGPDGGLTVYSGATLDIGTYTLTIMSSYLDNAGTITGTGTVDLYHTSTLAQHGSFRSQLSVTEGQGSKTWTGTLDGNIAINSGAVLVLTNTTTVNANITNNGTLAGQGTALYCNGASFTNNGQFNSFNYCRFSGSSTQTIGGSNATTFSDLTVDNSSGVTLNKDITVGGTLSLSNGALSIGANTLTINGAISASEGSITGGSTSNITVGGSGASTSLPSTILNNLILNRANGVSLGGDVSVSGTLDLSTGALSIGANTLTINGAISTTSGILTGGSSSNISIGGSGASTTLPTVTLNNITLNRANGISLGGDVTVGGTLTLTNGNITSGSNTITLGTSTSLLGTLSRTSGTIVGNFKRWFAAATITDVLFPIGTASNYCPANMSFTAAPSGGTITTFLTTSNPGITGLPLNDAGTNIEYICTDGYWTIIVADGLSGGTYSLDLTADGFDAVSDYTILRILKRSTGGSLTLNGTHSAGTGSNSTPIVHRTGMSGFSEFGIGNPDPSTFTDIEPSSVGSLFSFNEGSEDQGNGHSIDMIFNSLAGNGNVTVQQTNTLPSNTPCTNVCGYYWDISKEDGITSFSTDITFHYTDTDANGYTESAAFFGIAKFNSSTDTWQWLGGTVDATNNTVTVSGVTSFSTFALFRRIFGDITGDGYVDAADLQRLGDCWHETNSGEFTAGNDARFFNFNKNTDSGNQIIDAADLQVFGDCWHNGVE